MGRFSASNSNPPFIKATAGVQSDPVSVTAADPTGDMSSGIIPANASIVAVTSTDASFVITLPTVYVAGTEILMSLGVTGCQLRTPITTTKINGTETSNGSAQIKKLDLSGQTMYRCIAQGNANWVVTAIAATGGLTAGGTPDGV
tara:strand:+ start:2166 stop:2600 length:435 start_codon:yes stop_codon:yes gene_type:complete